MPLRIPNLFELAGKSAGAVVRGYELAKLTYKRPSFIAAEAMLSRWNGGDMGIEDAAVRRAMTNSWIYIAIQRKSMDISLGKPYVVQNPQGLSTTGTVIPGHTLLDLFRHPNDVMDNSYLWQYTHMWLDLKGNSYWFLLPDEPAMQPKTEAEWKQYNDDFQAFIASKAKRTS